MKFAQKAFATAAAGVGATAIVRALLQRSAISFQDKSVVITGGSRGLGLVLARELAAEGANLTIMARNAEEVMRAGRELIALGARVLPLKGDVREQSVAQEVIDRTVDKFGRIDVLINNAGIIQAAPIEHITITDFEDSLDIHMWGPLYMMLAAIPHMRRQGSGRIVNISSIGGKVAIPHLIPYSAGKFALVGLSDGMRAELATHNIHVTTVCPGLMRTGSHLNAQFKGRHEQEFAWFALFDSLPISSIDARRAARQIIEACRRGDSTLTISIQAQALTLLNALLPGFVAEAMKVVNRLLPNPIDGRGDVAKSGWESRSMLAPPLLTRLSDRASVENNNLPADDSILRVNTHD